ncbi:hypothetical protein FJZ39_00125 [Candidatus Saccharibacteria bacterium]|nr:hypothetical protein [Candidatus Saccharibacteria bacterium]
MSTTITKNNVQSNDRAANLKLLAIVVAACILAFIGGYLFKGAPSPETSSNATYAEGATMINPSYCSLEPNVDRSVLTLICDSKVVTITGNFNAGADYTTFVERGENSTINKTVEQVLVVNDEIRVWHNHGGPGCLTIVNGTGKTTFDACDNDDVPLVAKR